MMSEMFENLQRWRERRQAIRQLSAMPDHLLTDIGIERGNIEAVVHGLHAQQRTARQAAPAPVGNMVLSRG